MKQRGSPQTIEAGFTWAEVIPNLNSVDRDRAAAAEGRRILFVHIVLSAQKLYTSMILNYNLRVHNNLKSSK